jgi:hypothetical protein
MSITVVFKHFLPYTLPYFLTFYLTDIEPIIPGIAPSPTDGCEYVQVRRTTLKANVELSFQYSATQCSCRMVT